MDRSLVKAVLAVSVLLTAAWLLVLSGSPALLVAGIVTGVAGLVGLVVLARSVVLEARREVRR